MTAALGGTVHLNPRGREIGVARRIRPTDAGRGHALLRGKERTFDALCTHEDELATLPPGATVLASNETSAVQAATICEGGRSFWACNTIPSSISPPSPPSSQSASSVTSTKVWPARARKSPPSWRIRDLSRDPARKDLAWHYGVGADVWAHRRPNGSTAEVLPAAAGR